jgi:hypothetical protein
VLFQDAKSLMSAGRYAEACPKLAESQRLDPGTGTLLALALCHQSQGRSASAWAEFTEVAGAAQKDNRADRVRVSREHIRQLEPTLSRLTITVPPSVAGVKGLEVTRDGSWVGPAVWGTAVPLDPGEHTIEAWAPGKKRWTMKVQFTPTGNSQTVAVPALEGAPAAAPPPPSPLPAPMPAEVPAPSGGSGRRTAGFVVGGVGILALGVGAFFGVRAIAKSSDAKARCSPARCTDPQAVSTNDDAKVAAIVSDIGIGLGLAGLGVGVFLLVTAPSAPEPKKTGLQATPWVGPGQAGLTLRSAW